MDVAAVVEARDLAATSKPRMVGIPAGAGAARRHRVDRPTASWA